MNNKIKQISFLSAIVILVSGTIGSGIFFKNAELFQLAKGSIGFVLSLWILAAFGIIAFGIAIAQMSSKVVGNKGVLEWTKHFMPKRLHLASRNYVQLIFIPLICFALPLYAVKGIQQALSHQNIFLNGWEASMIAFGFFIWFAVITYVSVKIGETVQWITLIVKFIPLLILPILSILMKSGASSSSWYSMKSHSPIGFSSLGNGALVLIAGIPAIMFSVDGFYTVTTLRDKMTSPKKMSSVIVVGLSIVTIIYIWVSLSFMHGSTTGKYFDIKWLRSHQKISQVFSWLISIGILGVVNGYVQFSTNTYINLHKNNESWLTRWFQVKLFRNKIQNKLSAFISLIIFVLILYIGLTLIGIYGWTGKPINGQIQSYANILAFDNVITNFKSLLMFVLIAFAILFALKTFKRNTLKEKIVYIISIISVIFVFVVLIYQYVSMGVNMFGFRGADSLSSIISFILLVAIPSLCYAFAYIEDKYSQKTK